MRALFRKHALLIISAVAVFCVSTFAFILLHKEVPVPKVTPLESQTVQLTEHKVIGKSVEGREIEAYTYGNGATHLLFVGGIHGGYEWNSVVLAYRFIDYLKENPTVVPKNLTVAVIPSANPDGVYRVIGKEGRFTIKDVPNDKKLAETGRFNAHDIDLNRNFDCKWKPQSMWKNRVVSAGSKAFSEPEAAALRDFVVAYTPKSVVFWHSQANAVYASKCEVGILPETLDIMNVYAKASGYAAIKTFDQYETSGDSEGWLASINIPAITVELKTHETVEWEKNLAGVKALLTHYSITAKE
ncbi:MAG: Peptidase M14 carboxypeptidase A [Parcubacteria group bacterium GW2011_GWA1_47_8]|uniref:Peptidase M14 carboxypeptidase A n=1 Tax=Candidatus Giovannonibacteria bacterium GW2011_GWA2_45_21 TaxID=1618649 RepID=A0A0G1M6K6_9BACT|nr:MAG: Peptidase M14 carboxypeptidase A [Candidatus Giovannonibacteria bacterium GW2011_GWA2_45_21]KKU80056.1 MAG: Peptidase M14 carboxypeptidase A [Parcubacteria group bacterium GW2011_GWA1_47_8]